MRIVIITSSANSLFVLRKEFIGELVDRGYEVIALAESNDPEIIESSQTAGFNYRYVPMRRNGLNPFADFRTLKLLTAQLKEIKPDKVYCYLAKGVSYGCWAAKRARVKDIYALICGLGSVFRGDSVKIKLIRIVMKRLYKHAFSSCKKVIFQNNDDRQTLVDLKLLPIEKTAIVNGSGVDLYRYEVKPLPLTKTFLFIGRLLIEKGIREYIEAARIVRQTYPDALFLAVGDVDTNPSSLSQAEVDLYQSEGIVDFVGYQKNVIPFLSKADVMVLPSYHEGTPRCVLEAMAMGRPIITTDAPGCRETVVDGVNGYLVPIKDSEKLAVKMLTLIENPDTVASMGKESRRIAEEKYDVMKVNAAIAHIMNLDNQKDS